jgi:hypothetical protein
MQEMHFLQQTQGGQQIEFIEKRIPTQAAAATIVERN